MAKLSGPHRLGPLTPLVGYWEGDSGVDVSYRHEDDKTTNTTYFEKFWFTPIPEQRNGKQHIDGFKYGNTAWRHGEEAMIPFHDEIGYMLWDEKRGQVMRCVSFGRGICILAGCDAKLDAKKLHFRAKPGDPNYGILQNKYLSGHAELVDFESIFTFGDDGTFSYEQTLVLKMEALGNKEMRHTDKNTLHRVKRIHPSDEAA